MSTPRALFEVSWEVGHKVGGVHTVVASKARSMVERFGDAYVAVGPWLLSEGNADRVLEADPALEAFEEGCRAAGIPVRAGRWLVPGRPRALLVEFSGLYAGKDDILRSMWERHRVDSLQGAWDYVEPLLFGHAAGIVIERWWREMLLADPATVVQFHEWLAGAGLFHLRSAAPELASVFTVHSTALGRAFGSGGKPPLERLDGRTPEAAAAETGTAARHSLEAALARESDALAAVSGGTAEECAAFLGRRPDPLVPNGLDLDVLGARVGGLPRKEAASALRRLAHRFLGEDPGKAAILASAGRCEFRNKGFDLLLDAMGEIQGRPGPPVVLFLFVPAGTSGVVPALAERLKAADPPKGGGPLGISTHVLHEGAKDPVAKRCAEAGLANAPGSRVKVVHVPAYLEGADGVLGLRYEAVLQGADLALFPSFYDAWGYTAQEALALGVPVVTTDAAGFGRWTASEELGPAEGVHLLRRVDRDDAKAREDLAGIVEGFLAAPRDRRRLAAACRHAVRGLSWSALVRHHERAHSLALDAAAERMRAHPVPAEPPPRRLPGRAAAGGQRPRVFPLEVASALPAPLEGLSRLARNWCWAWDPLARSLFEELSPATFAAVRGNPVRLLREAPAADLEARAADRGYLARLGRCLARVDAHLAEPPAARGAITPHRPVAYLCAEFGIHESLPVYSGGLGVLAGDHLRSASDLGLPLVAVGLLYRRGYMRQRLEGGVQQRAVDDSVDPRLLPLDPVADADGRPVHVAMQIPGGTLTLRAWCARVGRVPLYLLDTDLDANRPEDRAVTHHLYGGDAETRLRQEIILGRGGVRLLQRLGIEPSAWHLNEGHGAFAALERVGILLRDGGLSFGEALQVVRATTAFTTHTPVPAGHDRFDEDLLRRYFSDASSWISLSWERFLNLGASAAEPGLFNMTSLAVHCASFVNGVSREHARVSRSLVAGIRPQLLPEEVPVEAVTNGVHLSAWTGEAMAALLGAGERPVTGADFAGKAAGLDAGRLWAARRKARDGFLAAVRRRIEDSDDPAPLVRRRLAGLDPDALLVGFARRFAAYKRAGLLLSDPARLRSLLDAPDRPVRVFYAGKAHPRDAAAAELLAGIARLSRSEEFAGRIFVLEDYDIGLARRLVEGVDVWLNNPRPPLEASGTSGMKAAANGVLNLSVGDGWWLEGYDGGNGWRIGGPEAGAAPAMPTDGDPAGDARHAEALYRLLENEVVPLFFRRDRKGIPGEWLERVKRSLATIPPVFDTARMVGEYARKAYGPLAEEGAALAADDFALARRRAAERQRLLRGMAAVRILSAGVADPASVHPGKPLAVEMEVDLGPLAPEEVLVELVIGRRDGNGALDGVERIPLAPRGPGKGPAVPFEGTWGVARAGSYGYALRVRLRPAGEGPPSFHEPVVWA